MVSPALADELSPSDVLPFPSTNSSCINSYGGCGDVQFLVRTCMQTEKRLFENNLYECKAFATVRQNYYTQEDISHGPLQSLKNACWSKFIDSNSISGNASVSYDGSEVFSGLVLDRKVELLDESLDYDWRVPCKLLDDSPEVCSLDIATMIKNIFKYKFPMDLIGDNPIGEINPTCPVMTIQGQTFQMCYLLDLVKGLKYPILLIFVLKTLTNL